MWEIFLKRNVSRSCKPTLVYTFLFLTEFEQNYSYFANCCRRPNDRNSVSHWPSPSQYPRTKCAHLCYSLNLVDLSRQATRCFYVSALVSWLMKRGFRLQLRASGNWQRHTTFFTSLAYVSAKSRSARDRHKTLVINWISVNTSLVRILRGHWRYAPILGH